MTTAEKFGDGAYSEITLDASALIVPTEFSVGSAYPNPFNPTVTIPFALPSEGDVNVSVFNILGQQIFESTHFYQAGHHRFVFDATRSDADLVSGVYVVQVKSSGQISRQKILLLK